MRKRRVDIEGFIVAERLGFAPPLRVDNKELKEVPLPLDLPDPLKGQGRDTYLITRRVAPWPV
jgi:hypothetical protein